MGWQSFMGNISPIFSPNIFLAAHWFSPDFVSKRKLQPIFSLQISKPERNQGSPKSKIKYSLPQGLWYRFTIKIQRIFKILWFLYMSFMGRCHVEKWKLITHFRKWFWKWISFHCSNTNIKKDCDRRISRICGEKNQMARRNTLFLKLGFSRIICSFLTHLPLGRVAANLLRDLGNTTL